MNIKRFFGHWMTRKLAIQFGKLSRDNLNANFLIQPVDLIYCFIKLNTLNGFLYICRDSTLNLLILVLDDIERNYRSEEKEDVVGDNSCVAYSGTSPKLASPRSPIPLHRQASPFPLESLNSRRISYQPSTERLRTINGECLYLVHIVQYKVIL